MDKKTWQEFKDSGLFWWINMILHTFGWFLVIKKEGKEIVDVFPARTKCRGFSEETNTEGYKKVSRFIEENAAILREESEN